MYRPKKCISNGGLSQPFGRPTSQIKHSALCQRCEGNLSLLPGDGGVSMWADGQISHSKIVSSWLDWAAFAVSTSRAQWSHGSLGPGEPEEKNQCKREAPSMITMG